MNEDEQRAAVVNAALSYEGAPWVHKGRAHGGIDCGGLIICSFFDCGLIPWIETPHYSRDFMLHSDTPRFLETVEKFARKVERAPRPADIMLFRHGRCISHGGIVIEWPVILHAVAKSGRVERGDGDKGQLAARYRGIWSLKDWT